MDQFLAALMGALVGGLVTIFGAFKLDEHQTNKRRDNLRAAVAVEVASLVELVKRQKYSDHIRQFSEYVLTLPTDERRTFQLPIKQSYFTIYEMNAGSIGDLPSAEAVEIIGFYQQARSIVDSVLDDTALDPRVTNADISEYYRGLAIYVDNLCKFGSELVEKLTTASVTERINATANRLVQAIEPNSVTEESQ